MKTETKEFLKVVMEPGIKSIAEAGLLAAVMGFSPQLLIGVGTTVGSLFYFKARHEIPFQMSGGLQ